MKVKKIIGFLFLGATLNVFGCQDKIIQENNLENKILKEFKIKSSKEDSLKENTIKLDTLDEFYNYNEKDLQKYNSWIDSTLNESKNKNSVIINKSKYKLYLIKNGKIDSEYPIELGPNPYDDKQREGDGCTPEGMYKITWKRDEGQTFFYKAFLINYPNKQDLKKGKTGGMIECHGTGSGKPGNKGGHNWTAGCIGLSNENLDKIFPFLKKGDRITIIKYTNKKLNTKDKE